MFLTDSPVISETGYQFVHVCPVFLNQHFLFFRNTENQPDNDRSYYVMMPRQTAIPLRLACATPWRTFEIH